MPRRRRDRESDTAELVTKALFLGLVLVALAVGGINGFARVFSGLIWTVLMVVLIGAVVALVTFLALRWYRAAHPAPPLVESPGWVGLPRLEPDASGSHQPAVEGMKHRNGPRNWTESSVRAALEEIDWYQFEKFCAALLQADGFAVERKGGAQPDGGVDLLVSKDDVPALIQCKHWRNREVQEKVTREMLGSMTHFKVSAGSIYTLKGWTKPAAAFAALHRITLLDGDALARQAITRLRPETLDDILSTREHRCPKCESVMVLRTGNFPSFWGCSRYPRCRGKLNQAVAR